jgi:hypothetical protein
MDKLKKLAKVVFIGETALTGGVCLLAALGTKTVTLYEIITTWLALDLGFLFLTVGVIAFIVALFWVSDGEEGESYLDFIRRKIKEELDD